MQIFERVRSEDNEDISEADTEQINDIIKNYAQSAQITSVLWQLYFFIQELDDEQKAISELIAQATLNQ